MSVRKKRERKEWTEFVEKIRDELGLHIRAVDTVTYKDGRKAYLYRVTGPDGTVLADGLRSGTVRPWVDGYRTGKGRQEPGERAKLDRQAIIRFLAREGAWKLLGELEEGGEG